MMHIHAYTDGRIDHNLSTCEKLPVTEEIVKHEMEMVLHRMKVL